MHLGKNKTIMSPQRLLILVLLLGCCILSCSKAEPLFFNIIKAKLNLIPGFGQTNPRPIYNANKPSYKPPQFNNNNNNVGNFKPSYQIGGGGGVLKPKPTSNNNKPTYNVMVIKPTGYQGNVQNTNRLPKRMKKFPWDFLGIFGYKTQNGQQTNTVYRPLYIRVPKNKYKINMSNQNVIRPLYKVPVPPGTQVGSNPYLFRKPQPQNSGLPSYNPPGNNKPSYKPPSGNKPSYNPPTNNNNNNNKPSYNPPSNNNNNNNKPSYTRPTNNNNNKPSYNPPSNNNNNYNSPNNNNNNKPSYNPPGSNRPTSAPYVPVTTYQPTRPVSFPSTPGVLPTYFPTLPPSSGEAGYLPPAATTPAPRPEPLREPEGRFQRPVVLLGDSDNQFIPQQQNGNFIAATTLSSSLPEVIDFARSRPPPQQNFFGEDDGFANPEPGSFGDGWVPMAISKIMEMLSLPQKPKQENEELVTGFGVASPPTEVVDNNVIAGTASSAIGSNSYRPPATSQFNLIEEPTTVPTTATSSTSTTSATTARPVQEGRQSQEEEEEGNASVASVEDLPNFSLDYLSEEEEPYSVNAVKKEKHEEEEEEKTEKLLAIPKPVATQVPVEIIGLSATASVWNVGQNRTVIEPLDSKETENDAAEEEDVENSVEGSDEDRDGKAIQGFGAAGPSAKEKVSVSGLNTFLTLTEEREDGNALTGSGNRAGISSSEQPPTSTTTASEQTPISTTTEQLGAFLESLEETPDTWVWQIKNIDPEQAANIDVNDNFRDASSFSTSEEIQFSFERDRDSARDFRPFGLEDAAHLPNENTEVGHSASFFPNSFPVNAGFTFEEPPNENEVIVSSPELTLQQPTISFEDLLPNRAAVISRHKENGGAEFQLPVQVLPPSVEITGPGLPVRFESNTTPSPSLVPLTDSPILWVTQEELEEEIIPNLQIDLTTARSGNSVEEGLGKRLGKAVEFKNDEELMLERRRKLKRFQPKNLVNFYPIHGKPFKSFIPDVEFASIT